MLVMVMVLLTRAALVFVFTLVLMLLLGGGGFFMTFRLAIFPHLYSSVRVQVRKILNKAHLY